MQDEEALPGNYASKLRQIIGMAVVDCATGDQHYITREELRRYLERIRERRKLQAREGR